jgi:hypothetical protein
MQRWEEEGVSENRALAMRDSLLFLSGSRRRLTDCTECRQVEGHRSLLLLLLLAERDALDDATRTIGARILEKVIAADGCCCDFSSVQTRTNFI